MSTTSLTEVPARPSLLWWAYELTMAGLALVVVWLLTMPDEGLVRTANLAIWAVFGIDYAVRITVAKDRRRFVRGNIPDLVAIMPLDFLRIARLARLARLVRLVRAGTILWRITADLRGVLGTNGLGYVLAFTTAVIIAGGFAAWAAEPAFQAFSDALWWSIVTATTVGYGDLSPESVTARVVAVALMLIGIGTLGMITGSIATYFLAARTQVANTQIEWIRGELERWDTMEDLERRRLAGMLQGMANLE